jgi:hypothetical protein
MVALKNMLAGNRSSMTLTHGLATRRRENIQQPLRMSRGQPGESPLAGVRSPASPNTVGRTHIFASGEFGENSWITGKTYENAEAPSG